MRASMLYTVGVTLWVFATNLDRKVTCLGAGLSQDGCHFEISYIFIYFAV
jgi:hypothetical protein